MTMIVLKDIDRLWCPRQYFLDTAPSCGAVRLGYALTAPAPPSWFAGSTAVTVHHWKCRPDWLP